MHGIADRGNKVDALLIIAVHFIISTRVSINSEELDLLTVAIEWNVLLSSTNLRLLPFMSIFLSHWVRTCLCTKKTVATHPHHCCVMLLIKIKQSFYNIFI